MVLPKKASRLLIKSEKGEYRPCESCDFTR